MRKIGMWACAAAALLFAPVEGGEAVATNAGDAAQSADVRCLIVMLRLQASSNETAKSSSLLGSMYYLGKLDGRAPSLDLEAALIEQFGKMQAADTKNEAVRCGNEMSTRGQAFEKIGEDLSKKGY